MRTGAVEPRVPPPGEADGNTARLAVHAAPADGEPSPFARMLHGLGHQINSGESMMRGAVSAARDLGPSELIALQAGVYRWPRPSIWRRGWWTTWGRA